MGTNCYSLQMSLSKAADRELAEMEEKVEKTERERKDWEVKYIHLVDEVRRTELILRRNIEVSE